ncbi:AT-rich interactive domain-containing protein 5B-like isoform X1 [Mercenaria mercenaria]|uniref:AT-rich interactive domain-containing protein 5B-like isoform X1 n=1 Tax=Mercenaria mercenaria TaxID=6596 RepID=UPI00234E4B9D|nr:AT-rich interactive domain-containing protein 5B-like isoform X1 [Mercenaria mercenaria]
MEEIKVKKFGPLCGKHGSSVFYKAFKYKKDGKSKIISLGQFFFMKILDSIPICIGELQLVWEDKPSATDLASVRLYFLPECTPDGRQSNHGEDEVLAYYEKIVLKLNDLASMVVHDVSWSDGRRAFTCARDKSARDSEYDELTDAFKMNSYGLDNRDIEKEKDAAEAKEKFEDSSPDVVIMTYPRYCRYRCMLKRLENCEDKWLHKTLVCALGGFSSLKENNRVYFCKNIFEHADLDDFELRCDHLAPNLKGRPRKRKGSKRDPNDSSDDSSSSSSFSAQPETAANKVRTGSRATPLRNGFRIDKINVSKDEQAFLIELHKYMKSRNTPIGRIPSLGFKQIDLFQFYSLAEEIGGYEQISMKRMWKHLYDKLGGNPGFTSAATCTRRHYEKLLLPFERYKNGKEFKPIQHKKKKFRLENNVFLSEKFKVNKQPEITDVKVKSETKIKTETKVMSEMKPLENGKAEMANNKEKVDVKDKALIIKQEIEKMKMRKDARKHGTSIMNKTNTKLTGTLEKKRSSDECKKPRWGEKGRRPSGGQKTVRELLHQNGQDSGEATDGNNTEKVTDQKQKNVIEREEGKIVEKSDNRETTVPSMPPVLHTPTPQVDTKSLPPQPILPSINAPRPMFYPQLIPVGGAIRNMTPIGMPFMIGPQFGFQTVSNQMQTMQAIGSAPGVKEEKPLNALNKLVSEQSAGPSVNRNAIPSHPGKNNPPPHITPPSAHSSQITSNGPLISPQSGPQAHRPITPAHSHNSKRQYPYPDTNRNHPTYSSNYSARDVKKEPVNDLDLKRQKLHGSQEKPYQPGTNEFEMPVLDLSMKTLRAQEARHQRGESLLFNTSFNKENRTASKADSCDSPQDLSLKSKTNSNGNERQPNVHKSVPLNIPFPRLPTVPTHAKIEEEVRKDRIDFQAPCSSKPILPVSSSTITTIGGLPVDLSSFVHPAFPQQMLMQGVFPTPFQLQQMIQGQVAAGMPMLRPDFIPSPLMFPPSMSVVAPTMFTNVMPSVAKTSTNTAPIVKR